MRRAAIALVLLVSCSTSESVDVAGKVPPGKPPKPPQVPLVPKPPDGEGLDLDNFGSASPRPISIELDGKPIRILPHRGPKDPGLYGALEGGDGSAVFTVHGNLMIGTIRRGRDVYQIVRRGNGPPQIIKAGPGRKGLHKEELRQGNPVGKVVIQDPIRVLVAYTGRVVQGCAKDPACVSPVDLSGHAIATTNQVASESGSKASFELAGTYAIAAGFDEADMEMTGLLNLLTGNAPGTALAGVKQERAKQKADIVIVLTDIPGMIQGQTALTPASKDTAFSIVNWDAAITQLAFVHEIGHQLGLNDDRDRCSTATYKSGFGFHHPSTTPDENWVTVMSDPFKCDPECVRIPRWSNPATTYKGAATGVKPVAATSAACTGDEAMVRNEVSVIADTAGAISKYF